MDTKIPHENKDKLSFKEFVSASAYCRGLSVRSLYTHLKRKKQKIVQCDCNWGYELGGVFLRCRGWKIVSIEENK